MGGTETYLKSSIGRGSNLQKDEYGEKVLRLDLKEPAMYIRPATELSHLGIDI